MSKKEKVVRKSGVGKLFLGIFLGFILCLGSLVGLGFFAYNNLSADWVNKTFKTDIDLGKEELNKKTIKDFVASAVSLGQNIDSYTLNDLDKDFGISVGDKLMGIDITDLKDVPVKDIADKAQDKFSNISADELKDVVNLEDMNLILNKTNVYTVVGDTLYYNGNAVDKNDIDYSIETVGTDVFVKIKDQSRKVEDGKVEFELRYLPLTKALGDFMNTMGDKITVGELVDKENGFGVELPSYLCDTAEKKAKTINELEDLVNGLRLADFLGYTISGETVLNGTTPVTGIVAKLAKKTVNELKGVEEIINDSTVAEVLDYTYEDNKYYYMNNGVKTEVKGIMKAIAGTKVKELTAKVEALKLDDVLVGEKTGVLTIIGNPEITKIGDAIQKVIDEKTLAELADANVIEATREELEAVNLSAYSGYDGMTLGDVKVNGAIDLLLTILNP